MTTETCAYCGDLATTADHVVPRAVLGKHRSERALKGKTCPCKRHSVPVHLLELVAACERCNLLKLTRRLIPPSWADRLTLLQVMFPGTPWRVWHGDVREPAFREVHA